MAGTLTNCLRDTRNETAPSSLPYCELRHRAVTTSSAYIRQVSGVKRCSSVTRMSLIKCKQCSQAIADDAATCPNCGTQVQKLGCCTLVFVLLIIGIVILIIQAAPMLLYMLAMIF